MYHVMGIEQGDKCFMDQAANSIQAYVTYESHEKYGRLMYSVYINNLNMIRELKAKYAYYESLGSRVSGANRETVHHTGRRYA